MLTFANYINGAWTSLAAQGINIGGSPNNSTYGSIESAATYGINLNIAGSTQLAVNGTTGYVGIGTTTPATRLQVSGGSVLLDNNRVLEWLTPSGSCCWAAMWEDSSNNLQVLNNNAQMTLGGASGNVGIGTTSPQQKLSVNGTVQAKEVLVNTGWSDYVFDTGYRLTPLSEVASYIDANHHLPEIPTAAEVAAKGVSVGEMEAKLLAKIEELTLHMIEADRRIGRLEQENDFLRRSAGQERGR